MIAKLKRLAHVNDIERVVLVLFAQVFEYADFLLSLTMKAFLVAYDFERHMLTQLVIVTLQHLAEAALAEYFKYLEAVDDVVVLHRLVAAIFVVVAVVVRAADDAVYFFCVLAHEVDLGVVEYFVMLERGQLLHERFHGRFGIHGVGRAPQRAGHLVATHCGIDRRLLIGGDDGRRGVHDVELTVLFEVRQ